MDRKFAAISFSLLLVFSMVAPVGAAQTTNETDDGGIIDTASEIIWGDESDPDDGGIVGEVTGEDEQVTEERSSVQERPPTVPEDATDVTNYVDVSIPEDNQYSLQITDTGNGWAGTQIEDQDVGGTEVNMTNEVTDSYGGDDVVLEISGIQDPTRLQSIHSVNVTIDDGNQVIEGSTTEVDGRSFKESGVEFEFVPGALGSTVILRYGVDEFSSSHDISISTTSNFEREGIDQPPDYEEPEPPSEPNVATRITYSFDATAKGIEATSPSNVQEETVNYEAETVVFNDIYNDTTRIGTTESSMIDFRERKTVFFNESADDKKIVDVAAQNEEGDIEFAIDPLALYTSGEQSPTATQPVSHPIDNQPFDRIEEFTDITASNFEIKQIEKITSYGSIEPGLTPDFGDTRPASFFPRSPIDGGFNSTATDSTLSDGQPLNVTTEDIKIREDLITSSGNDINTNFSLAIVTDEERIEDGVGPDDSEQGFFRAEDLQNETVLIEDFTVDRQEQAFEINVPAQTYDNLSSGTYPMVLVDDSTGEYKQVTSQYLSYIPDIENPNQIGGLEKSENIEGDLSQVDSPLIEDKEFTTDYQNLTWVGGTQPNETRIDLAIIDESGDETNIETLNISGFSDLNNTNRTIRDTVRTSDLDPGLYPVAMLDQTGQDPTVIDSSFIQYQNQSFSQIPGTPFEQSDLLNGGLDIDPILNQGSPYNATAELRNPNVENLSDPDANSITTETQLVLTDGDTYHNLSASQNVTVDAEEEIQVDLSNTTDVPYDDGVYVAAVLDGDGNAIAISYVSLTNNEVGQDIPGQESLFTGSINATQTAELDNGTAQLGDVETNLTNSGEARDTDVRLRLLDANGDTTKTIGTRSLTNFGDGDQANFTFSDASVDTTTGQYNFVLEERETGAENWRFVTNRPLFITDSLQNPEDDITDFTQSTSFSGTFDELNETLVNSQSYTAIGNLTYEEGTGTSVVPEDLVFGIWNTTGTDSLIRASYGEDKTITNNTTIDFSSSSLDGLSGSQEKLDNLEPGVYPVSIYVTSNSAGYDEGYITTEYVYFRQTEEGGDLPTESDISGDLDVETPVTLEDGNATFNVTADFTSQSTNASGDVRVGLYNNSGQQVATLLENNSVQIDGQIYQQEEANVSGLVEDAYNAVLQVDTGSGFKTVDFQAVNVGQDPGRVDRQYVTSIDAPTSVGQSEEFTVSGEIDWFAPSNASLTTEISIYNTEGEKVQDNISNNPVVSPTTQTFSRESSPVSLGSGTTSFQGAEGGVYQIGVSVDDTLQYSVPIFVGGTSGEIREPILPYDLSNRANGTLDISSQVDITKDQQDITGTVSSTTGEQFTGDALVAFYDFGSGETYIANERNSRTFPSSGENDITFDTGWLWPPETGSYLAILAERDSNGDISGLDTKPVLLRNGPPPGTVDDLDLDTRVRIVERVETESPSPNSSQRARDVVIYDGEVVVGEMQIGPGETITDVLDNSSQFRYNRTVQALNNSSLQAEKLQSNLASNDPDADDPLDRGPGISSPSEVPDEDFNVSIFSSQIDFLWETNNVTYSVPRNENGEPIDPNSTVDIINRGTIIQNKTEFTGGTQNPIIWEQCDVRLQRPQGSGEVNRFNMDDPDDPGQGITVEMRPNSVKVIDRSGDQTQNETYEYPVVEDAQVDTPVGELFLERNAVRVPGCIYVTDFGSGATLPAIIGPGNFQQQENLYFLNVTLSINPFGVATPVGDIPDDPQPITGFQISGVTGETVATVTGIDRSQEAVRTFGEVPAEFEIESAQANADITMFDLEPSREYRLYKNGEEIDSAVADEDGTITVTADNPPGSDPTNEDAEPADYQIITGAIAEDGVVVDGDTADGLIPDLGLSTPALILLVVLALFLTGAGYLYFRDNEETGELEWYE